MAQYREGQSLLALTAYDASFAAMIDKIDGIDIILVGDSLGMVVQGHATTLPVTVADIEYHTRAVCRGARSAFIIADMPFLSASNHDKALKTAWRLMARAGAQMVKFECGPAQTDLVRRLSDEGIPVCAHIGYRPQFVHKEAGYFARQRQLSPEEFSRVEQEYLEQAQALCQAGADILLVECVPAAIAEKITQASDIPVIGIGSGASCDGQILVLYDLLGISYNGVPKFVDKLALAKPNISEVIEDWVGKVQHRKFGSKPPQ